MRQLLFGRRLDRAIQRQAFEIDHLQLAGIVVGYEQRLTIRRVSELARKCAGRTGLQPAGTSETTEFAGSVFARVTSTTMIAPSGCSGFAVAGSWPSGLHAIGQLNDFGAAWLVVYSHCSSGEKVSAIGALATGIFPTFALSLKPSARAFSKLITVMVAVFASLTYRNLSSEPTL